MGIFKTSMKKSIITGIFALGILFSFTAIAAVLSGSGGGTNYSTSTPANDGYCLKQSSSTPFLIWSEGPCSASSATTTINGVSGPTFTFSIVSTSSQSSITTTTASVFLNLLAYTSSTYINVSPTGTILFINPGFITTSTISIGGISGNIFATNNGIQVSATGTIGISIPLSSANGGTATTTPLGSNAFTSTAFAPLSNVSGTTNYIPVFTGTNSIGNSVIYQSSTNIGIGTNNPLDPFSVETNTTSSEVARFINNNQTLNQDYIYIPSPMSSSSVSGMGIVIGNQFTGPSNSASIENFGATNNILVINDSTSTGHIRLNTNGADVAIGNIAPQATLDVSGTFNVSNHVGHSLQGVSVSSCGTSPSVTGSDNGGIITVGTIATGCVLNFSSSWNSVPACTISNQSMSITSALGFTVTTAAITITQSTGLSSDKLDYICQGNPN
jgi:hypothetical protein